MSNHTPGPWSLGRGHNTARDHSICDGPRILAKVLGFGYPSGQGWHQTSAANAHLMVAAPELLAALEATVAHLSLFTSPDDAISNAVLAQAHAATAKARGPEDTIDTGGARA